MGVKRGVSLYCYQQAEFFRQMTWKDMLREVATNVKAPGIEMVSEATIPQYPIPPESFIFEWNNEIARWGLKAVTMDNYMDVLQFRDHIMTHAECAERIKYDLRLAKKLGFENLRLVHEIPFEAIELALPLAEELDVRITNEIHAPQNIKPTQSMFDAYTRTRVAQDVAFIQRTGTRHYGLQPDFSLFQNTPSKCVITYFFRDQMSPEAADALFDELMQVRSEGGPGAVTEYFVKNYKQLGDKLFFQNAEMFADNWLEQRPSAQPEDLYDIAPYIFCCHGKFNEMTEIPGQPGQYEESSMLYKQAIDVLKAIGYDGYICSEYEGQRYGQDVAGSTICDEIEQVRRHHEMMARLIGE